MVEALNQVEEMRFNFDNQSKRSTLKMINGALGADQEQRALLQPNALYTITVSYEVAVAEADEYGNPGPANSPTPPVVQKFAFHTDSQPPQRLDPWVLTTYRVRTKPFSSGAIL